MRLADQLDEMIEAIVDKCFRAPRRIVTLASTRPADGPCAERNRRSGRVRPGCRFQSRAAWLGSPASDAEKLKLTLSLIIASLCLPKRRFGECGDTSGPADRPNVGPALAFPVRHAEGRADMDARNAAEQSARQKPEDREGDTYQGQHLRHEQTDLQAMKSLRNSLNSARRNDFVTTSSSGRFNAAAAAMALSSGTSIERSASKTFAVPSLMCR